MAVWEDEGCCDMSATTCTTRTAGTQTWLQIYSIHSWHYAVTFTNVTGKGNNAREKNCKLLTKLANMEELYNLFLHGENR